MAALGAMSLQNLGNVSPYILERANSLADFATSQGMDISIPAYGGFRSFATQQQLVAWRDAAVAKGSPSYAVAPAGKSNHEDLLGDGYGHAFDVKINYHAESSDDAAYRKLADFAPALGLRAGYYFHKSDPFHFEDARMKTNGTSWLLDPTGGTDTGAPSSSPTGAASWLLLLAVAFLGVLFLSFAAGGK
jgi:hypothetical protein